MPPIRGDLGQGYKYKCPISNPGVWQDKLFRGQTRLINGRHILPVALGLCIRQNPVPDGQKIKIKRPPRPSTGAFAAMRGLDTVQYGQNVIRGLICITFKGSSCVYIIRPCPRRKARRSKKTACCPQFQPMRDQVLHCGNQCFGRKSPP